VSKIVSRKTVTKQPKEFTKRQLYAMLAEAVRNTS
jgi:GcrA cell cycle regulator